MKKISLKEVKAAFERIFFQEAKKLEIHIICLGHEEENSKLKGEHSKPAEEIKELSEWKKKCEFYPDFYEFK